ncbi:MAG: DUF4214 domain-containing protein [Pseudomonadota bacterium]
MENEFGSIFFEDFFDVKWAEQGQSRTISWSVVNEGTLNLAFPAGTRLDIVESSEPYVATFARAFQLWDDALDTITFVQTDAGNRADVALGIVNIDGPGGSAGRRTSTWFNSIITRSTIDFDLGDIGTTDLLTTALHEIGNVLGLGDIRPTFEIQSIQEDPFPETFSGDALWAYDRNLIRTYYGESTTDPDPMPGSGTTSGDDTIAFGAGDELINGLGGTDRAVWSTASQNYSVQASAAEIVVSDRNGDGGTDRLTGFEIFEFADQTLMLSDFSSALALDAASFTELAEMYVAYFDSAADAIGLYFWADKLAEGFTLDQIAEFFFDQPETRALYPDTSDTDAFVRAVYQNVLGRTPDQDGFAFWQPLVASGAVSAGTFVLEVIKGAKAGTSQTDVAYLAAKADLGIYFSVTRGMSDVTDARQVMQVFGDQNGVDFSAQTAAAVTATDSHYFDAIATGGGDLLVQLLGVVDDPFVA